jgi:apolipoprotein N-acyltransferase
MACKGCGGGEFAEKLGTCGFCIGLAAISATVFWLLYDLSQTWPRVWAISLMLLSFAILLTLLLVAHVIAYLRRRGTEPGPRSRLQIRGRRRHRGDS